MEAFFCKKTMLRTASAAAVVSAIAVLAGCSKSTTEAPRTQQVAEVGVFKVAQEALQITTELPGRTAAYQVDRKSTRLNSSHSDRSRMPSSA